MNKKIYSIESIRALACIFVLICHFKGAFFPNSTAVAFLMNTPINIVFSGNTPVRLMFLISGLVLSYKYFSKKCYEQILPDAFKRYFRLGIPVFFACFFAYALMRLRLMANIEVAVMTQSEDFLGIFNNFPATFMLFLKEGLYGALFLGNNAYVSPMWTMSYEMLGSIMILCAIALLKDNVKCRMLFYVVFLLIFRNYYTYFIIGMIVADFICHSGYQDKWNRKKEIICTILLVISGLYICNPQYVEGSTKDFWKFSIACLVMFPCFIKSTLVDKIFGEKNKPLMWIAKNSYAIYLLHWPIVESVSCRTYLKLIDVCENKTAIVITFVFTLLVVLVTAECFTRFVDCIARIIGNNMSNIFFRKASESENC